MRNDTDVECLCTAEEAYRQMLGVSKYTPRQSQELMISTIAQTISVEHAGKRVVVSEGATGVGKSLAYLIGAYPGARRAKKTLIVSTATLALQNQLLSHDIPTLCEAVGVPIAVAIAKGARNYVCDHALMTAAGKDPAQAELELGIEASASAAVWETPPTPQQRDQVEAMVLARSRQWDGDMDSYPETIDPTVRKHVTLGRQGCIGRACAYRNRCPHKTALEKAGRADLIVTNHALLLSDLYLGGGALLPALENAVLVIDEAHELPDIAVERFTVEIPIGSIDRMLQRLGSQVNGVLKDVAANGVTSSDIDALMNAVAHVRSSLAVIGRDVAEACVLPLPGASPRRVDGVETERRWRPAELPSVVEEADGVMAPVKTVGNFLRRLRDKLRDLPAGVPLPVTAKHLSQLIPVLDVMGRVHAWCRLLVADREKTDQWRPPTAFWASSDKRGASLDLVLFAAPSDVASRLRGWLIDRAHAVVMTSATLRTMGTFDHFVRRTGLGEGDGTQYLVCDSPFDLERQATVIVPVEACDPRDEQAHTQMVTAFVGEHYAPDSGTLVLFTSRRQMQSVFDGLDPSLQAIVLLAGTRPVADLVATHQARIRAGSASIIFGLDGLSEGVDLPGRECECVIIARLPFRSPAGPIAETRAEWLKANGRSYFAEESIPETHRRLVQRLGRLLRTEFDHGTIYVLDRRIASTAYGRSMWNALPPYTKQVDRPARERSDAA